MTRWLALLLAGCTGGPVTAEATEDVGAVVATDAGVADATDASAADTRPAVVHEIVVGAVAFTPFVTVVAPGDSVLFRWGTVVPTSVTSGFLCMGDGMFSSPPLRSPMVWRLTFVGRGPYPFMAMERCEQETGIIVVE